MTQPTHEAFHDLGLPSSLVVQDLSEGGVTLSVDATLYPLEALYGASYIFIDRCYVLLDRPGEGRWSATLAPKKGEATPEVLRAMVGEFANELLSQAWRLKIVEENRAILETVTTQALVGAMGAPTLDDLASFDFTEDGFDDPLGIAMSWEEKQKEKQAAKAPKETEAKP
jgi:His-Xaa-Ser system protein HxsD